MGQSTEKRLSRGRHSLPEISRWWKKERLAVLPWGRMPRTAPVAQPSPAAGSRGVSLRGRIVGLDSRGETPREPAGADARATLLLRDDKNSFKNSFKMVLPCRSETGRNRTLTMLKPECYITTYNKYDPSIKSTRIHVFKE